LDYWNHNSAYHSMIVTIAESLNGDVLDVGCGEGLLVERLAKVSMSVTGIDRDETAIHQAEVRTAGLTNASVSKADFMEMKVVAESYDLLTFVAVLHHLDLGPALRRSRNLLRPGGRLVIVGLSANKSVGDYARSAVRLPAVRLMSRIHREARSVLVAVMPPSESLKEIKQSARRELPGVLLRGGLYYRYVLLWTKPSGPTATD
jgi:2-polyprenyl-3-methyl-5-hydroxy-6-metoxy-1,4-benzoquinol methylase